MRRRQGHKMWWVLEVVGLCGRRRPFKVISQTEVKTPVTIFFQRTIRSVSLYLFFQLPSFLHYLPNSSSGLLAALLRKRMSPILSNMTHTCMPCIIRQLSWRRFHSFRRIRCRVTLPRDFLALLYLGYPCDKHCNRCTWMAYGTFMHPVISYLASVDTILWQYACYS